MRTVLAGTVNPACPEEVDVDRPSDALEARAAAETAFTALLIGLGALALLVAGVGIACLPEEPRKMRGFMRGG